MNIKYWYLDFDGTVKETEVTDNHSKIIYNRRFSTQIETKEEAEKRKQSLINFFRN